jgi:hypothetical protein
MLIDRCDEYGNSIHLEYLDNQLCFLTQPHEILDKMRARLATVFENWEGREQAAEERHAEPHQKRLLRIQGYQDRTSNHGERLWLRRQRLKYKLKKDEIAKFNKAGRTIGDLGVEASLQGAWATKLDKEAVAEDILLTTGGRVTRVHFCSSPNTVELKVIFDNLQYPPEDAYFVYFSDDACYAARTPTGVWRANLDISSCDASHSDALFTTFAGLHPAGQARNDIDVLVDQCRAPIVINAPDKHNGRKMKVVLQSPTARLFSGSTLTTVINGFANSCIAQSIHDLACTDPATTLLAARNVGYVITVEECPVFEDIQFLKSSPVQDTMGNYHPVLNLGVLLRAYGTCKGDLPRNTQRGSTMEERANSFQKGLLQGLYPGVSFPFLDALKKSVETALDSELDLSDYAHRCTDTVATFSNDAIFKRYALTKDGLRMSDANSGGLADLLDCRFGHEHASLGADAVLQKDYGLSCWPTAALA